MPRAHISQTYDSQTHHASEHTPWERNCLGSGPPRVTRLYSTVLPNHQVIWAGNCKHYTPRTVPFHVCAACQRSEVSAGGTLVSLEESSQLSNGTMFRFYPPLAISWVFMGLDGPECGGVINRLKHPEINAAACRADDWGYAESRRAGYGRVGTHRQPACGIGRPVACVGEGGKFRSSARNPVTKPNTVGAPYV